MTVVTGVFKSITGPVVRAVEAVRGGAEAAVRLLFNGVDQYFTHSAWSPSGANFDIGITYAPAAGDIGFAKTLIAGLLTKNASNHLVVTYTDVNAVVNTLTLTALTLAADTEYHITIVSDGNGVEISAGGETVSDVDTIDPSALSVDTWLADSGGTGGHANGIPSDLSLTDKTLLQGGEFLLFDATSLRVNVGLTLTNYTAEFWFSRDQSASNRFFGNASDFNGRAAWFVGGVKSIRYTTASGQNRTFSSSSGDSVDGQFYYLKITVNAGRVNVHLDGEVLTPTDQATDGNPVNIEYLGVNSSSYGGGYSVAKFTNLDTGDTYEYLTDGSVTNNGDGTATAENTGNTGPSFNATVQNFTTGDLVTLPNNSHAWPMDQDQATQLDTAGSNDGTIVNYDGGMAQ